MEKPNYYGILPANVRYDKNLKPMEKILYCELTALSNKYGYCNASNSYFAKLYEVHKMTVSAWINNLKKYGYINIQLIKDEETKQIQERRIYIATPISEKIDTYKEKDIEGINEKTYSPISEKTEDNITSINNTRKNNNNNVVDNFSAVEKKEVIPSAVRQEIEMAIRSNNWNIKVEKLLMLAEGDYMLVLQQIKHFGEKGLRYTIAAIKGKYEVNQEPVKTAEDEKKERFKEWEHSIQLIEHQYKNCKEKIKPEIYEWMGEFLKDRGLI